MDRHAQLCKLFEQGFFLAFPDGVCSVFRSESEEGRIALLIHETLRDLAIQCAPLSCHSPPYHTGCAARCFTLSKCSFGPTTLREQLTSR